MSSFIFIVLIFLPIGSVSYLIWKCNEQATSWIISAVITSIVFYFVMQLGVHAIRIEKRWNLDQYDLNNDGIFSAEEWTPQAEAAMDDFATDTGLTFAPFTGLFIAPIYSVFWHFLAAVLYRTILNIKALKISKKIVAK